MAAELYPIRNKLAGLSYAFTLNGVELPVLDITHPGFAAGIDEKKLAKLLPYVEKNADRNANKFNNLPAWLKRYFARRSFAMAELLETRDSFASGISTLMMKMGPQLVGKGKKRFWDRQVTKGFGALVIRMRARDIGRCLAAETTPLLRKSPGKNLCFINIAGGAASDSLNALFLAHQQDPALLKDRKIEINVLDIDTYGPAFAERSVEALKAPGGRFREVDVSFRHIRYDWNQTRELADVLAERKGWLQICSSEGGLFEYGSDEVIARNLTVLHDYAGGDAVVAGTLIHDLETVDAGIVAAMKISTSLKPRFLGLAGLKSIIEQTGWKLGRIVEGNPRYLVFSLIGQ
jgi:hypothetical protein